MKLQLIATFENNCGRYLYSQNYSITAELQHYGIGAIKGTVATLALIY
jgi:hypothetical protein